MNNEFIVAFFIGIVGSSHCLAMCGGISSAIVNTSSPLLTTVLYNTGRLICYSVIGALFGLIGILLIEQLTIALTGLKILAGVLLVLMGLYVSRWHMGLIHFEKLFTPIWRLIQPLAAKSLQQSSSLKLISGFLWGWLPCGLVYSTASWAASFNSVATSSILMTCFALGTFPSMLLTSYFSRQVAGFLNAKLFKTTMSILLIGYGIHTIFMAVLQLFNKTVS